MLAPCIPFVKLLDYAKSCAKRGASRLSQNLKAQSTGNLRQFLYKNLVCYLQCQGLGRLSFGKLRHQSLLYMKEEQESGEKAAAPQSQCRAAAEAEQESRERQTETKPLPTQEQACPSAGDSREVWRVQRSSTGLHEGWRFCGATGRALPHLQNVEIEHFGTF